MFPEALLKSIPYTFRNLLAFTWRRAAAAYKSPERSLRRRTRARVLSATRWLGEAETRTRFKERRLLWSVAVLAIAGEAVAAPLYKQGPHLAGIRREVGPFEVLPDAFCNWRFAWGHTASQCPAAAPRCALCKEGNQTSGHRCSVEGAMSSEAMRAHTRWPSAGTARGRIPPRPTCAR